MLTNGHGALCCAVPLNMLGVGPEVSNNMGELPPDLIFISAGPCKS